VTRRSPAVNLEIVSGIGDRRLEVRLPARAADSTTVFRVPGPTSTPQSLPASPVGPERMDAWVPPASTRGGPALPAFACRTAQRLQRGHRLFRRRGWRRLSRRRCLREPDLHLPTRCLSSGLTSAIVGSSLAPVRGGGPPDSIPRGSTAPAGSPVGPVRNPQPSSRAPRHAVTAAVTRRFIDQARRLDFNDSSGSAQPPR